MHYNIHKYPQPEKIKPFKQELPFTREEAKKAIKLLLKKANEYQRRKRQENDYLKAVEYCGFATTIVNRIFPKEQRDESIRKINDILQEIINKFIAYQLRGPLPETQRTRIKTTLSEGAFLLELEVLREAAKRKSHEPIEVYQVFVSEKLTNLFKKICEFCCNIVDVKQTDLAIVLLGSLATQQAYAYSDVEYIILLNGNVNKDDQKYRALAVLIEMIVIGLGETPLKHCEDIVSCDAELNPYVKYIITGFCIRNNLEISLINQKKFYLSEDALTIFRKREYFSSVLLRPVFLYGDDKLYKDFYQELNNHIKYAAHFHDFIKEKFIFDCENQDILSNKVKLKNKKDFNIKELSQHTIDLAFELNYILYRYSGIAVLPQSIWEALENLGAHLSKEEHLAWVNLVNKIMFLRKLKMHENDFPIHTITLQDLEQYLEQKSDEIAETLKIIKKSAESLEKQFIEYSKETFQVRKQCVSLSSFEKLVFILPRGRNLFDYYRTVNEKSSIFFNEHIETVSISLNEAQAIIEQLRCNVLLNKNLQKREHVESLFKTIPYVFFALAFAKDLKLSQGYFMKGVFEKLISVLELIVNYQFNFQEDFKGASESYQLIYVFLEKSNGKNSIIRRAVNLINQGSCRYVQFDYEGAMKFYERVVKEGVLDDKYPLEFSLLLFNNARIYLAQRDYQKAFNDVQQALRILAVMNEASLTEEEKEEYAIRQSQLFCIAGKIYFESGQLAFARERFDKAQVVDNLFHQSIALSHLSNVYFALNEIEGAKIYCEKALTGLLAHYGDCETHLHVAVTQIWLARIYLLMKDKIYYDKAKKLSEKAIGFLTSQLFRQQGGVRFLKCIHSLHEKTESDFCNKKKGCYLYRKENPKEIYALVVYNDHSRETLNLTKLAKGNNAIEEIIMNIEWPKDKDMGVLLNDELIDFVISLCQNIQSPDLLHAYLTYSEALDLCQDTEQAVLWLKKGVELGLSLYEEKSEILPRKYTIRRWENIPYYKNSSKHYKEIYLGIKELLEIHHPITARCIAILGKAYEREGKSNNALYCYDIAKRICVEFNYQTLHDLNEISFNNLLYNIALLDTWIADCKKEIKKRQEEVGSTLEWLSKEFSIILNKKSVRIERNNFLERIQEKMKLRGPWQVPKKAELVLLYGMSGIGKSELALDYIHRFVGENATCLQSSSIVRCAWFYAKTDLVLNFIQLGKQLGIEASTVGLVDKTQQEKIAFVQSVWEKLETQPAWVVVFDSVDDAEILKNLIPFLPDKDRKFLPKHEILLTSQCADLKCADFQTYSIEVLPFSPDEASRYLKGTLPDEAEHKYVTEILDTFGTLPLVLSQAVTTMRQSETQSAAADYLQKLQEVDWKTNSYNKRQEIFLPFLNRLIFQINQIMGLTQEPFEKPKNVLDWMQPLIACVYLGNYPISHFLLKNIFSSDHVDSMINMLKKYSLINVMDTGDLEVRNLVQIAFREWFQVHYKEQSLFELQKLVMHWSHYLRDHQKINHTVQIEFGCTLKSLILHGEALVKHLTQLSFFSRETIRLFVITTQYRLLAGDDFSALYEKIEEFMKEVASKKEHLCPELAPLCDYLAYMRLFWGNNAKAKSALLEGAYSQQFQGKSEAIFSVCLLGDWLNYQGRYQHTEVLLDQIPVKKLFESEINYGFVEYLCGNTYFYRGQLKEAYEKYEKALHLKIKYFGDKHGEVARAYRALGNVLTWQGKYQEALEYYQTSLKLKIDVYGAKRPHSRVASTRQAIGECYYQQGKYPTAIEHFNQILNDKKETLGKVNEYHPSIAYTHLWLGKAYFELGQYNKARQHLKLAKEMFWEQQARYDHLMVSAVLLLFIELQSDENSKKRENVKEAMKFLMRIMENPIVEQENYACHSLLLRYLFSLNYTWLRNIQHKNLDEWLNVLAILNKVYANVPAIALVYCHYWVAEYYQNDRQDHVENVVKALLHFQIAWSLLEEIISYEEAHYPQKNLEVLVYQRGYICKRIEQVTSYLTKIFLDFPRSQEKRNEFVNPKKAGIYTNLDACLTELKEEFQPDQNISHTFEDSVKIFPQLAIASNPEIVLREELTQIYSILQRSGRAFSLLWGGSGVGKTQLAFSYAYHYAQDYSHIFLFDTKNEISLARSCRQINSLLGLSIGSSRTWNAVISSVFKYLSMNYDVQLIQNKDFESYKQHKKKPSRHLLVLQPNHQWHLKLLRSDGIYENIPLSENEDSHRDLLELLSKVSSERELDDINNNAKDLSDILDILQTVEQYFKPNPALLIFDNIQAMEWIEASFAWINRYHVIATLRVNRLIEKTTEDTEKKISPDLPYIESGRERDVLNCLQSNAFQPIEVAELSPKEVIQYVRFFSPQTTENSIEKLIDEVGSSPWVLTVVLRYLKEENARDKKITLDDYVSMYERRNHEIRKNFSLLGDGLQKNCQLWLTKYRITLTMHWRILTVLDLTLSSLKAQFPLASNLLQLCAAYLYGGRIERKFLYNFYDENLRITCEEEILKNLIHQLAAYGLLLLDESTDTVRIHPLIRSLLVLYSQDESIFCLNTLVEYLHKNFIYDRNNLSTFKKSESVLLHVYTVFKRIEQFKLFEIPGLIKEKSFLEQLLELAIRIGSYYLYCREDTRRALFCLESGRHIVDQNQDLLEHPLHAVLQGYFGFAHYLQNDGRLNSLAIQECHTALSLYDDFIVEPEEADELDSGFTQLLREVCIDQARVWCVLGSLYLRQGDYRRARECYDKAQKSQEELFQKESNFDCGITIYFRGNLACDLEEFSEAETMFAEAETILKAILSGDRAVEQSINVYIGLVMDGFGKMYYQQGLYQKAEKQFSDTITFKTTLYPSLSHPEILSSRRHLGDIFYQRYKRDPEKNKDLLEKAEKIYLEVKKAFQGTNHPEYTYAIQGLGHVACAHKDYTKALKWYQSSHHCLINAYGNTTHPSIVATLGYAAEVLRQSGDIQGAHYQLEQVLNLQETQVYGKESPSQSKERTYRALRQKDLTRFALGQIVDFFSMPYKATEYFKEHLYSENIYDSINRILADHHLCILLGEPGSDKTGIAIHQLSTLLSYYPAGVFWIDMRLFALGKILTSEEKSKLQAYRLREYCQSFFRVSLKTQDPFDIKTVFQDMVQRLVAQQGKVLFIFAYADKTNFMHECLRWQLAPLEYNVLLLSSCSEWGDKIEGKYVRKTIEMNAEKICKHFRQELGSYYDDVDFSALSQRLIKSPFLLKQVVRYFKYLSTLSHKKESIVEVVKQLTQIDILEFVIKKQFDRLKQEKDGQRLFERFQLLAYFCEDILPKVFFTSGLFDTAPQHLVEVGLITERYFDEENISNQDVAYFIHPLYRDIVRRLVSAELSEKVELFENKLLSDFLILSDNILNHIFSRDLLQFHLPNFVNKLSLFMRPITKFYRSGMQSTLNQQLKSVWARLLLRGGYVQYIKKSFFDAHDFVEDAITYAEEHGSIRWELSIFYLIRGIIAHELKDYRGEEDAYRFSYDCLIKDCSFTFSSIDQRLQGIVRKSYEDKSPRSASSTFNLFSKLKERSFLDLKARGRIMSILLSYWSVFYIEQDDLKKAQVLLQESQNLKKHYFEADHPESGISKIVYGLLLYAKEKYGDALDCFDEAERNLRQSGLDERNPYCQFIFYARTRVKSALKQNSLCSDIQLWFSGKNDSNILLHEGKLAFLLAKDAFDRHYYQESFEKTNSIRARVDFDEQSFFAVEVFCLEGRILTIQQKWLSAKKAYINALNVLSSLCVIYSSDAPSSQLPQLPKELPQYRRILHVQQAIIMHYLGLNAYRQGQWTFAKFCYEEAKTINELRLRNQLADGINIPTEKIFSHFGAFKCALSLQELGDVFYRLGQYSKAIECFKEVIDIQIKNKDAPSKDKSSAHYSLARAELELCRYQKAKDNLKIASDFQKKGMSSMADEEPPFVNAAFFLIQARAYYLQGFYDKAKQLLLETLQMERNEFIHRFGVSKHYIIVRLNTLIARIEYRQGLYAESLSRLQGALKDNETIYSKFYFENATIHRYLGDIYLVLGELSLAKQHYHIAKRVAERCFPKTTHPEKLRIEQALARFHYVYATFSKDSTAIQAVYQSVIQSLEKILKEQKELFKEIGSVHPDIAITYRFLANVYTKINDYEGGERSFKEGIQQLQQCYADIRERNGKRLEHPHVVELHCEYAEFQYQQGLGEEARACLAVAENSCPLMTDYGAHYPYIAKLYHSLAKAFLQQSGLWHAEHFLLQAFKLHLDAYGERPHIQLSELYQTKAMLAWQAREKASAVFYLREAYWILKQLFKDDTSFQIKRSASASMRISSLDSIPVRKFSDAYDFQPGHGNVHFLEMNTSILLENCLAQLKKYYRNLHSTKNALLVFDETVLKMGYVLARKAFIPFPQERETKPFIGSMEYDAFWQTSSDRITQSLKHSPFCIVVAGIGIHATKAVALFGERSRKDYTNRRWFYVDTEETFIIAMQYCYWELYGQNTRNSENKRDAKNGLYVFIGLSSVDWLIKYKQTIGALLNRHHVIFVIEKRETELSILNLSIERKKPELLHLDPWDEQQIQVLFQKKISDKSLETQVQLLVRTVQGMPLAAEIARDAFFIQLKSFDEQDKRRDVKRFASMVKQFESDISTFGNDVCFSAIVYASLKMIATASLSNVIIPITKGKDKGKKVPLNYLLMVLYRSAYFGGQHIRRSWVDNDIGVVASAVFRPALGVLQEWGWIDVIHYDDCLYYVAEPIQKAIRFYLLQNQKEHHHFYNTLIRIEENFIYDRNDLDTVLPSQHFLSAGLTLIDCFTSKGYRFNQHDQSSDVFISAARLSIKVASYYVFHAREPHKAIQIIQCAKQYLFDSSKEKYSLFEIKLDNILAYAFVMCQSYQEGFRVCQSILRHFQRPLNITLDTLHRKAAHDCSEQLIKAQVHFFSTFFPSKQEQRIEYGFCVFVLTYILLEYKGFADVSLRLLEWLRTEVNVLRGLLSQTDEIHVEVGILSHDMARCYAMLEDNTKAKEHYQKALHIQEIVYTKYPHPRLAKTYMDYASFLANRHEFKEAFEHLKRARANLECFFTPDGYSDFAEIYYSYAFIYCQQGIFSKALKSVEKAIKVLDNTKNRSEVLFCVLLKKAILVYSDNASSRSQISLPNKELSYASTYFKVHTLYADLYRYQGDYKSAIEFYKKALMFAESLCGGKRKMYYVSTVLTYHKMVSACISLGSDFQGCKEDIKSLLGHENAIVEQNQEALRWLKITYARLLSRGSREEQSESWELLESLEKSEKTHRLQKAAIYNQMGHWHRYVEKSPQKAIEYYQRVLNFTDILPIDTFSDNETHMLSDYVSLSLRALAYRSLAKSYMTQRVSSREEELSDISDIRIRDTFRQALMLQHSLYPNKNHPDFLKTHHDYIQVRDKFFPEEDKFNHPTTENSIDFMPQQVGRIFPRQTLVEGVRAHLQQYQICVLVGEFGYGKKPLIGQLFHDYQKDKGCYDIHYWLDCSLPEKAKQADMEFVSRLLWTPEEFQFSDVEIQERVARKLNASFKESGPFLIIIEVSNMHDNYFKKWLSWFEHTQHHVIVLPIKLISSELLPEHLKSCCFFIPPYDSNDVAELKEVLFRHEREKIFLTSFQAETVSKQLAYVPQTLHYVFQHIADGKMRAERFIELFSAIGTQCGNFRLPSFQERLVDDQEIDIRITNREEDAKNPLLADQYLLFQQQSTEGKTWRILYLDEKDKTKELLLSEAVPFHCPLLLQLEQIDRRSLLDQGQINDETQRALREEVAYLTQYSSRHSKFLLLLFLQIYSGFKYSNPLDTRKTIDSVLPLASYMMLIGSYFQEKIPIWVFNGICQDKRTIYQAIELLQEIDVLRYADNFIALEFTRATKKQIKKYIDTQSLEGYYARCVTDLLNRSLEKHIETNKDTDTYGRGAIDLYSENLLNKFFKELDFSKVHSRYEFLYETLFGRKKINLCSRSYEEYLLVGRLLEYYLYACSDIKKAEKCLKRAFLCCEFFALNEETEDPLWVRLKINEAYIDYLKGDTDRAVTSLRTITGRSFKSYDDWLVLLSAYELKAKIFAKMGQIDDAISMYQEAKLCLEEGVKQKGCEGRIDFRIEDLSLKLIGLFLKSRKPDNASIFKDENYQEILSKINDYLKTDFPHMILILIRIELCDLYLRDLKDFPELSMHKETQNHEEEVIKGLFKQHYSVTGVRLNPDLLARLVGKDSAFFAMLCEFYKVRMSESDSICSQNYGEEKLSSDLDIHLTKSEFSCLKKNRRYSEFFHLNSEKMYRKRDKLAPMKSMDESKFSRNKTNSQGDTFNEERDVSMHLDITLNQSSKEKLSYTHNSGLDDSEDYQLGWNCFDTAVNLGGMLSPQSCNSQENSILTRRTFVDYVIEHKRNEKYRKLLAPEIKHAAALTVSYMIMKKSDDTEEINRAIELLVELFQLRHVVESDDVFYQALIDRNIEKLSENKSLLEFPRGLLPKIMRTDALKDIVIEYQNAHHDMNKALIACNEQLGQVEGQRLNEQELTEYFASEENQLAYSEAFKLYCKAREVMHPHEEAFDNFCESIDTYENYVKHYYGIPEGSKEGGWFAFQREFEGERSTSMIDIASLFLEKQIIVKSQSGKIIYSTQCSHFEQIIEIQYNGVDHFEAISPLFFVKDAKVVESQSSIPETPMMEEKNTSPNNEVGEVSFSFGTHLRDSLSLSSSSWSSSSNSNSDYNLPVKPIDLTSEKAAISPTQIDNANVIQSTTSTSSLPSSSSSSSSGSDNSSSSYVLSQPSDSSDSSTSNATAPAAIDDMATNPVLSFPSSTSGLYSFWQTHKTQIIGGLTATIVVVGGIAIALQFSQNEDTSDEVPRPMGVPLT